LIAVAVVVVVLLGVGAAWLVGGDDLTRQIAVFAAVVATLGLVVNGVKNGYDIWDKERERRKKESEGKERVKVTAIYKNPPYQFGSNPRVGVEVYNDGPLLNVRRVLLKVNSGSGDEESPLLRFVRMADSGEGQAEGRTRGTGCSTPEGTQASGSRERGTTEGRDGSTAT
jgi:hypothetical protein